MDGLNIFIIYRKRPLTEKVDIICAADLFRMPNYDVVLEAAWLVRDVKSMDDAIGVAISESGKRLNQKRMEFVDVEVGETVCPSCGTSLDAAFLVAGTALVGLLFKIKVYNAEEEGHATRIAKSMIGKALGAVPLKVVAVTELKR